MQLFFRKKLIFILPAIIFVGGLFYLLNFSQLPAVVPANETAATSTVVAGGGHSPCLAKDEAVDFELHKSDDGIAVATINILNKRTGETIQSFSVDTSNPKYPSSVVVQPHDCNIYVLRAFNINFDKSVFLPGYRQEIWKYNYNGQGEKLITLASIDENGKEHVPFSLSFKIDPTETYLTLIRGYLGSEDYAVVVKDIKTLQDVFVLTQEDAANKYGAALTEIGVGPWIDANHFVGFVTEGATVHNVFFVDKNGWQVTLFSLPQDAVATNAWSPDYKLVVYNNGPGWIGIAELTQQIYAEWRKEGREKSLFLYNFFTGEKITLATVTEPSWDFKPLWISDTELRYTLPSGATKTYKIPR